MPILEKTFSSEKYRALYSVDEKFDGLRLDSFIKEYLPTFSRESIKKKIKSSDKIVTVKTEIVQSGAQPVSVIMHWQNKRKVG